jgi:hypothetical protein
MSTLTHPAESECLALPAADVAKLMGISERHLWACHSSGKLGPRPIARGRAKRWRRDEPGCAISPRQTLNAVCGYEYGNVHYPIDISGDCAMPANVRIQPETYDKLRQLADEAGVTMPEVLAEAIDELFRKRFLDECNRAYGRLKADPKAWKQELEERKVWEQTLSDGLEDA